MKIGKAFCELGKATGLSVKNRVMLMKVDAMQKVVHVYYEPRVKREDCTRAFYNKAMKYLDRIEETIETINHNYEVADWHLNKAMKCVVR